MRAGKFATSLLVSLAAGFCDRAPAAEEWGYEVMPLLWAAGIDGRQGFDGQVSDVDAGFGDLVEFLDTGVALRMRASRAPWGWYAEASYVELGDDIGISSGTLNIKSEQTFAEGGISYDLAPRFAIYGGARFQRVDLDLRLGGSRLSRGEGWLDAVAGFRWTPVTGEHWIAWIRADAGAGGSDLVWLAEAGAGYRWGSRWGTYAAYRVLDTDHASSSFVYDMRQSGLLLGFGIRF